MTGEWCYFKNAISKDVCEFIIREFSKLPKSYASVGVAGELSVEGVRKSKVSFVSKENDLYSPIVSELWNLALQANDDFFNFNVTKLDYVQFAEYDESYSGNYKRHHDVFWMNGDPKYHRKLTCVVQLTDVSDYSGGDLQLFSDKQPNYDDFMSQGTVVFFPSFIEHQVNPVTKGTRHSLTAWFDGPKWT